MRLLVWLGIIWGAFAGGAVAQATQPAEPPPADFAGGQYIDSSGCVFLRQGRGWTPRLAEDGAPVCGFPPSKSAWGRAGRPVEAASFRDPADIERELTVITAVADGAEVNLRDGVDLADFGKVSAPVATSASVATPAATPESGIGAEIARGLAVRSTLSSVRSGPDPNDRLCGLLGLQPAGARGGGVGDDPTGGHCGGRSKGAVALQMRSEAYAAARPVTAPTRATEAAPSMSSASATSPTKGPVVAARPLASAAAMAKPVEHRGAEGPGPVVQKDAQTTRKSENARGDAEYIGPGARFVQIGRFESAGAEIAVKALNGLGYRAVREKVVGVDGKRFVMAGPFATREALVAALDRLRNSGYRAAVAR